MTAHVTDGARTKGARGPGGATVEGSSPTRQKSQNPPACVKQAPVGWEHGRGGSTAGLWLLFIIFFSGGRKARDPMEAEVQRLKGNTAVPRKDYSGHTDGRNETEEVGRGQRKRQGHSSLPLASMV